MKDTATEIFAPELTGGPRVDRTTTRRRREWVVVGAAIVVTLVILIIAAARTGDHSAPLHPDNTAPNGAHALAELLRAEGVNVQAATRMADLELANTADTTVLVTDTEILTDYQRETLAMLPADLVLVGTPYESLGALSDAVETDPAGSSEPLTAQCAEEDGAAAARISHSRGSLRALQPDVEVCFPIGEGGAYATWHDSNGAVRRMIADGDLLSNASLDRDGNAALAMRALGHHENLLWYMPMREASNAVVYSPPEMRALTWFLIFFAAALVATRVRRFGPPAREDLPVVVRGGEIVRGVGRLYHARRQYAHAATLLRAGTKARMRRHLGLPAACDDTTLSAALAALTQLSEREVQALLAGSSPSNQAQLVELARLLARFERKVELI
ncbi:MAG: DUF4350 domain-containing protein [Bowdeniella nasicola]|nr:DUF4350 domain-containing protein [Bowdeniella nasicola]